MPKVVQLINCRSNENSLTTVPSCLLNYLAPPMTHPWYPVPTWPHIPRCVLVTKFPIPDRSTGPSSLPTGPSFHMRSKPPTLFSFPVSLDRQETQRVNEGARDGALRPKQVPDSTLYLIGSHTVRIPSFVHLHTVSQVPMQVSEGSCPFLSLGSHSCP